MLNVFCCAFLATTVVPPDVVSGGGSPKTPVEQTPTTDDLLKALLQKKMPRFFRQMFIPTSGSWNAKQERLVLAELAWRQAADALRCRNRTLVSRVFQGMKPFIPDADKRMVIPTIDTVDRQNVPVRQLGWVEWKMKDAKLFRSEVYAGMGPSDNGKSPEPCWTMIGDGHYAREWTKDKDTGKYEKDLGSARLDQESCPQGVCVWGYYYDGLIGTMDVLPADLWRMRIAGGTLEGLRTDLTNKPRVCVSWGRNHSGDGGGFLFRFYFDDTLERIVQIDSISSSPAPDNSGRVAFLHGIWTFELATSEMIPKAVFSFGQSKGNAKLAAEK